MHQHAAPIPLGGRLPQPLGGKPFCLRGRCGRGHTPGDGAWVQLRHVERGNIGAADSAGACAWARHCQPSAAANLRKPTPLGHQTAVRHYPRHCRSTQHGNTPGQAVAYSGAAFGRMDDAVQTGSGCIVNRQVLGTAGCEAAYWLSHLSASKAISLRLKRRQKVRAAFYFASPSDSHILSNQIRNLVLFKLDFEYHFNIL